MRSVRGLSRERWLRMVGHRTTTSVLGAVALAAMSVTGCGDDDGDGAQSGRAEVLVQGAELHGSNGITVDRHGRLFIASAWGREIVVMDRETGEILDRYGPDSGVEDPDDVAFGPDGSLYWTDFLTGEVGRRQPDGTVTKQTVGIGVNPIAFSDDGRLFVAQAFFADGLYELEPDLAGEPRVVIPGSETAPFPKQLNGMDIGPDGKLYAPQPELGTIVSIDVDTATVTAVASGLSTPVAVDFDAEGRLFVAIAGTGEIARVDLASGATTTVGKVERGIDNMAFDADDRLFVTDNADGSVHEILANGRSREVSRPGLIAPGPVAVISGSDGESLYVGDVWTLVKLDGRSGRQQGLTAVSSLLGSDGIIQPHSVTADGSNLILSTWTGSVQVWDPTSEAVIEQIDGFAGPLNAIRFRDDLVVAESAGQVVRHDPATGERTTLTTDVETPAGLASRNDDLWVADWGKGTILHVVADGEVLAPPVAVVEDLDKPEGLAVDGDGTLLVVETGRRQLTRVDPGTGATTTVASDLGLGAPAAPNTPPIWSFNGVAVGDSGTIYITGDVAAAVYRIEP